MQEDNMYRAPASSPATEANPDDSELASKTERFFAAIIDWVIVGVPSIIFAYLIGYFDIAMHGHKPPIQYVLAVCAINFTVFVIANTYLLSRYGQTIGKSIQGIKIVTLSGEVPSRNALLFVRYMPIYFSNLVPLLGVLYILFDALLIFRSDRRCIHDILAGTKVVNMY